MMKFFLPKIKTNGGSSLRWLQWVAVLIAVGLFAALSLLLTPLVPVSEGRPHEWGLRPRAALIWINGIAALLAIVIAPYLLHAFERMQRRAEQQYSELNTLHAIDRAINQQFTLDAVLEVAIKEATRAVDAEIGALYLWGEGRGTRVEQRALYGISPAMQAVLGGLLDERARALAEASGAARRPGDLDRTWQTDRLNSSLKLRNLIAVPVQYQDRPLGLFLLGNRSGALAPGAGFSDEDERLLAAIAGTVGVAAQNARFVQESRRRGEMLRALVAHTGEAIAASSDARTLMRLFAGAAARILGCPRVAVYGHDEPNNLFVPLAATDGRTGQGESALSLFESQPLPAQFVLMGLRADGIPDSEPHRYANVQAALLLTPGAGDLLAGPGVVFVLCARDRRPLGLLCLADLPPGEEVAEFAQALAAQAAVTLENARLFSELNRLYEREKHIAGELQNNLLPAVPTHAGEFEFAWQYQAALDEAKIGGDFLDYFPLDRERIGFVMADVSGKGLKAAMQTATVKYTLRAFAHDMPDEPGRVLAHVNDVLCSAANPMEGFITLFYGVLNTRTGALSYASAGHEPPLLRRAADGAVVTLSGCDGMVLGCVPALPYGERALTLAPGDFLLLYTDGVTESRAATDGDFLGTEGLQRVLPPSGVPAPDVI
ncbi:MAG: SpoIIE family protein phosphatase, partial [Armatimonadetes bacterium]|nr:SpoIIE family protein phosphatase [Armatimonadota bacterium]